VPPAAALPLVALGAALASVPGYHAGEWIRGQALAVFGGAPPAWARLAAGTLMVAIFLGLPMAAAWVGYVRAVLARPRLDGVTRCGWCGGALTGVRDRRCPECGRLAGSTAGGVKGDAPVARRLGTRMRDWGVAAAVFSVAMAGAAAVYYPALERWFGVAPTSPTWSGVAGMIALVWPAAALSLLALHAVARRSAPLCGRSYCGSCGADLAGITSPECPACRAGL
jgi:ribosomal protein L34E